MAIFGKLKETKVSQDRKKGRIRLLVAVITFGLPLLLLLAGVLLFIETTVLPQKAAQEAAEAKAVIPSEILNNKSHYNKQRITLRGKVSPEPVVCQRESCPQNDLCCGCPSERNLLIADAGTIFRPKTKGRLRILDFNGEPVCQRRPYSCDYDCGDWKTNSVYDVSGVFSAEAPPRGWQLSLDYYFLAENKRLVKEITFGFSVGNFFNDLAELFSSLTTSSSYVLY